MSRTRFSRELPSAMLPSSAAELRSRGITQLQLQEPRWRRTSRGVYVPRTAGVLATTPTQRILDVLPLIPPDGALTGWAAAFVHGVDSLDGLDSRTMAPLPMVICCHHNPGRAAAPDIRYLRAPLSSGDVRVVGGVPVASPMRTAFDGARLARSVEDAVVFVDATAHAGVVTLAALSEYVAQHRGWKGAPQAWRATGLADAAARSPGESRLRVSYRLEALLPAPLVNVPIFDLRERLLGIGDLFDERAGFVTEYDGGLHRERGRHHADNVREELFERAGLVVVRADGIDLWNGRASLVQRLRAAYQDGLTRDRRRDGWTLVEPPWWLEQQDPLQLLTDQEQATLFADL